MNKKLLKQLITESYTGNKLNQQVVLSIADTLNRKELKTYIKALKHREKMRTVYIDTPGTQSEELLQQFTSLYEHKKIIYRNDPSLLSGIRVTSNDDIFELSVKHHLDQIIQSLDE